MSDTVSIRNGIELSIGKEWDICIDKFGIAFVRECAKTYRENTGKVFNEKISFLEWCRMASGHKPAAASDDRLSEIQTSFPKGSRVRLIKYGGKQELPLGIKGTVRGVSKNGDILVAFDSKRRARLAMGRDLCEIIQASDDTGLTDDDIVTDNIVLYKLPSVCTSCGRLLEPGTHFRTMVFKHENERRVIEMCSQCVRYIRKHGLTYEHNGLRCVYTDKR